ncbi:MAG: LLM class flavin-dependent oxidoreductase [Deltaproteobacteria bacterium]|nr:LLM class flavin-dependent oxidoreductase [Deltaproteobacteria bacterium]
MIHIGFRFPIGSGIPVTVRPRFAEKLEELGYESFWFPHVVSRDIPAFDSLEVLTAAAVRTQRIHLGTAVLQVPLYHPVDLARRLVTLDHMSNGRLIFGVGVGFIPKEFRSLGLDYKERAGRAVEALEILERLWTEPEVTYEGKYFKLHEVVLEPKPVQKPHIKVLVGGGYHGITRGAPGAAEKSRWSQGAIRRIARFGDGWVSVSGMVVEELEEGMERIKKAAREMGREIRDGEFDLTLESGYLTLGRSVAAAREEAREFYGTRVARGFYQVQGNPDLDTWVERGSFGSPEVVAEKINEWLSYERRLPALKRIILMIASLDPISQLERFHNEVRPLLKLGPPVLPIRS